MKRISLLSLVVTLATSAAYATDVNRSDVVRARADGERMSRAERLVLKSRVILAEAVRSQLVLAQVPMNALGLAHQRGPATVLLGTGQATAVAVIGGLAFSKLTQVRFGELDRAIESYYRATLASRAKLRVPRAKAAELRGLEIAQAQKNDVQFTPSEVLRDLEAIIAKREQLIDKHGEALAHFSREFRWYEYLGRPTRVSLGVLTISVAAIEGYNNILAVSLPEHGDAAIQHLTDFIDDARATLEAR